MHKKIAVFILSVCEAGPSMAWPWRPVGAAAHIGPTIPWTPPRASNNWDLWGITPPDPMGYRLPSIPPLRNPVLARDSVAQPFPRRPNPGIPNIVYYDPRGSPPPGAVPIYQPAFPQSQIIGPPDWSRDSMYMDAADPVPLPPSFDDLYEYIPADAYSLPPPIMSIPSNNLATPERPGYNPGGVIWDTESSADLFHRLPGLITGDTGETGATIDTGVTTGVTKPSTGLTKPSTRPSVVTRPTRPVPDGVTYPTDGQSNRKPIYLRPPTRDVTLGPYPKPNDRPWYWASGSGGGGGSSGSSSGGPDTYDFRARFDVTN